MVSFLFSKLKQIMNKLQKIFLKICLKDYFLKLLIDLYHHHLESQILLLQKMVFIITKTSSLLRIPPTTIHSPTFRLTMVLMLDCDLCSRMETPVRQILQIVVTFGGRGIHYHHTARCTKSKC